MANVNTSYNFYGSERVESSSSGVSYSKSSNNELDVTDFMKLFCTELTNQDIFSDSSSSSGGSGDYLSQLAQFTSLQNMQTLTEIIYAQYGASMVGKTVSVASYDNLGNYTQDEGVVESVSLLNGEVSIVVNGKTYPMSSVMEVATAKTENSSNNGSSDNGDSTDTEGE